jgi:hypothetical protein
MRQIRVESAIHSRQAKEEGQFLERIAIPPREIQWLEEQSVRSDFLPVIYNPGKNYDFMPGLLRCNGKGQAM